MKILHTSDWHLGKVLKGQSRLEEQIAVLAEVVAIAQAERPDLVIVAGDLFDSAAPTAETKKIVVRALTALRRHSGGLVAIAGNHDHGAELDALRPWADAVGITLRGTVGRAEDHVITGVTEGGEAWRLAALPFVSQRYAVRASEMFELSAAEASATYADHVARLVAALTESFADGSATVNLAAAHLTVVGGKLGGGERDAHTIEAYAVPSTVFPASAHYVALGHLHRRQQVAGPCPVHYCGSPLAIDFGEEENKPSVSIVEATAATATKVRPIRIGSAIASAHGTGNARRTGGDRRAGCQRQRHGPRPGVAAGLRAGAAPGRPPGGRPGATAPGIGGAAGPATAPGASTGAPTRGPGGSFAPRPLRRLPRREGHRGRRGRSAVQPPLRGGGVVMRPLRLDLHGFTVFRQPTTLDFTDADFFVLVGATGSGKSTVLDAICFALYGTVPRWGDRRRIEHALAPSAGEARVRLVFEASGARFVATRVVRRDGKGRVATTHAGLEQLPQGFDLTAFDAAPAERGEAGLGVVLAGTPAEMDDAVAAAVGLPYEQFTSCVVLPQGEFARFLHAKPAQRQEILVNLLGLHVYQRIGERAGILHKEAEARTAAARSLLADLSDADEAAQRAAEESLAIARQLVISVEAELPALAEAAAKGAGAQADLARIERETAALAAIVVPAGAATRAATLETAHAAADAAGKAVIAAEEKEEKLRAELGAAGDRATLQRIVDSHVERDTLAPRVAELAAALAAAEKEHAKVQTVLATARQDAEKAKDAVIGLSTRSRSRRPPTGPRRCGRTWSRGSRARCANARSPRCR